MTFFSYRSIYFFFNDTATTEIYTLSLHDALPIYRHDQSGYPEMTLRVHIMPPPVRYERGDSSPDRSEEHTSELQSLRHLVWPLLLEKKKLLVVTSQSLLRI